MATSVVAAAIAISQRTLATRLAAAGSRALSSAFATGSLATGSLMAVNLPDHADPPGATEPGRREIVVAPGEAGDRLDRMLANNIAELSRSRLKTLILAGHVAISAQTIRDPSHRVNAG